MVDLTEERQAMDKVIDSLRIKKEKLDNSTTEARMIGGRISFLTNRMLFITQELTHVTLHANRINPKKKVKLRLEPYEIGYAFEEEFGCRSDYFNHRVGLFNDIKDWIIEQHKK